jgi:Ca2+-transporting ATPase
MADVANRVAWAGVGAGALAALVGALRGRPLAQLVRGSVALAVAGMPEGLPVVTTAALVRSMRKLRKRGLIVRRLASAETLGGVDVVCMDKTGTLTRNAMRLEQLWTGGEAAQAGALRADAARGLEDPVTRALVAGVLNSDVELQANGGSVDFAGSSTEKALVAAARQAGLDVAELGRRYPRRALRERRPGRDYVVTVHDTPDGAGLALVKGAPEQVVELCSRDDAGRLDPARKRAFLARAGEMANGGLRVLGIAWRPQPGRARRPPTRGFAFAGLVGLGDPLRPRAAETVARATRARIRTILMTGDHRRTAEAIARAVGLEGEVVEGSRGVREALAGPEDRLARVAVLARVTPDDKLAVVRRLRELGHVVAMVGDGLNDAPALKAADVGVAVEAGSNDLARQSADVVLGGGDLGPLLKAIGEGRVVNDNLRRALRFLLATNASEIALVLAASLAGVAEPLSAMQLLWLNLVSDTLPALALASQPGRRAILARQPARPGAPLVSGALMRRVLKDGAILAGAGAVALAASGQAAAFTALVAAQLGYALACRSPGVPLGRRFKLYWGASVAVQALAILAPPVRRLLGLPGPSSPFELLGFGAGLIVPWLVAATDPVIVRQGEAAAKRRESRWVSTFVPSSWAGAWG